MTRHIAAFRPRLFAIGALALATLLSACGGGGGSTNPPPPLPLSITTVSLPSGVAGKIYNETLATANAVGTVTWSLSPSSGILPTGLTLSPAGDLSGTPSSVATFNFTIEATDSDNRTATEPYQVAVYPLLVVTTQSLTSATLDSAFSQTLQAMGGVPPYIWSAPGGLPPGVSLSSTGVLSGDPQISGAQSVLIDVQDSATSPQMLTPQFSWLINDLPFAVATTSLPGTYVGSTYAVMPAAAAGYSGAFTITSGSLPPGLVLSNNEISGIPTAAGSYPFTLQFQDAASGNTTSQNLRINVKSGVIGRNDSPATAVPLSSGVYRASISPLVDPPTAVAINPDNDYFQLSARPGQLVNLQIYAARGPLLTPDFVSSPLNSVIEVVDANGNQLNICSDASAAAGPFEQPCMNDDIPNVGSQPGSTDSQLYLQIPTAGAPMTFYLHVLDYRGDARPDMLYDLSISGVN